MIWCVAFCKSLYPPTACQKAVAILKKNIPGTIAGKFETKCICVFLTCKNYELIRKYVFNLKIAIMQIIAPCFCFCYIKNKLLLLEAFMFNVFRNFNPYLL